MDHEETRKILLQCMEYIAKEYPDSTIGLNTAQGYKFDETYEGLLEELANFVSYDVLSFCGCGCRDISLEAVRDYLYIVKVNHDQSLGGFQKGHELMKEKFGVEHASDDCLVQFMAYTLDGCKMTEHGTSINGCWLTEVGNLCLYILDLFLRNEYPEDYEEEKQ